MATPSQLITIPEDYIFDETEARQRLLEELEAARSGKRMPLGSYVPGSRSITDTIRTPEQLAAIYPSNQINEAIARAQATGGQLPGGATGRTLNDILAMSENLKRSAVPMDTSEDLLAQAAGGDILAQTKAREARRGAGGGGVLPTDLVRATGSEGFPGLMAQHGPSLTPSVQMQLERMHDQAVERGKVPPVERRELTALQGSHKALGEIQDAYNETTASSSGKAWDTIKTSLARNPNAVFTMDQFDFGKLTPAERKFAAKYNSFLDQLRQLSGDPRFSNDDALRSLVSIGNPMAGPEMYNAQLDAKRGDLESRFNVKRDGLTEQQFNVKGFEDIRGKSTIKGGPKAGAVVKGYRFKGGDPSKQENWEKAK